MNRKMLKGVGAILVLIMFFSVLSVALFTQRVMATTAITISPLSGAVGETIRVNGTINTENGNFTVKWNQTINVFKGSAVGFNVDASFVAPPTIGAPSGRNVTITLIDDSTGDNATANFTLYTEFSVLVAKLSPPMQLLEGSSASILVNVSGGEPNTVYAANLTVKNPANQTHWTTASMSNTTKIGSGSSVKTYPQDFPGAHTNFTGIYSVAFNGTIAADEFFVGLTDKSKYRRGETVVIRATGYSASELVEVDIRTGSSSVSDFPKNWTVNSVGTVNMTWEVPLTATSGTYTVSVTNATAGGTVKIVKDIQDFLIVGIVCQVQTQNLASEQVAGVAVEVYNQTTPDVPLLKGNTNSTGWIQFNLNTGNYTFKAFYRNVEVFSLLNQSLNVNATFTFQLRLVNIVATVITESGERVPLIDIALKYNYTRRDNTTLSATASMLTNLTGMAETHDLFTNKTYRVEAKRSGMLFRNTTLPVEFRPASPIYLNITLPSYTMNVHVLDSKGSNASGILIRVYEWAAGVTAPLQSLKTNSSGDASFLLPFGRYRLRAYKDDVFLNETAVNLKNQLAFTFNLNMFDVDVTVSVVDFFGQPIANAEVKIERKIDQEYVPAYTGFTSTGGSTIFPSIVGGDSRILIYVGGHLVAVKTQFLGTGSNDVTFRIGEYVVILGYPIETGLFALFSFIVVLTVVVLVLARGRLMKAFGKKLKK